LVLNSVALCENRRTMNFAFPAKALACGGLLLGISLSSSGLTLGRAQGAAFVGKPLDMRVQLQLDGGEDAQAACLGAEVFYGDSQVDPARVSVQLEPVVGGGASQVAVARVQSPALINEPIVTVNLRAGCQQQRSFRRYTLFPDVITNLVVPPAVAQPRPAPAPSELAIVSGTGPLATLVPAQQRSSTSRKSKAAPSGDAPETAIKRQPGLAKALPSESEVRLPKPKKTLSAGKPRLKLDTLDLLIERDPVLQASSELAAPPPENPEKRAEAAALWKSLNASPQEMVREDAKAMAVSRELKSLYAVTNENQKGLIDLAAQVQRAETERYANWLVYSLVALWVLSMAALVWTVLRLRAARRPNWSQGLDAGDSLMAELVQDRKVSRESATASPGHTAEQAPASPAAVAVVPAVAPAVVKAAPAPMAEVDFDLDLMMPPTGRSEATVPAPGPAKPAAGAATGAAAPSRPSATTLSHPWVRDFSISVAGGMRAIDSEELMDVRQQADFFMSLGEHQKAVDILTTRIAQCGESSPLVCLDLLKIYHALGRESEYEFMRTEFNNWFTGRVPAFPAFGDEGHALEHYPQVVSEIVALWPDPRVLEYIESCIYHHANDADWSDFDLHAFRDLLLLHGVAKRIVRNASDSADSHAAELVRIPARVPIASVGAAPDRGEHNGFVHRAGAHYRGAWKHNAPKKSLVPPHEVDPQADIETRGAPLGAMKVPPSAATQPIIAHSSGSASDDGDRGPVTDFNFLNLR